MVHDKTETTVVRAGFRSGFVAIAGRPNVGKSTLMNRLAGEKIAIVSNKPQTTRDRITGVLTGDGFQAAFIDTPGLHEPKTKLGGLMMRDAEDALYEADVVIFVAEAGTKHIDADAALTATLAAADTGKKTNAHAPVVLVLNKIDKIPKHELLNVIGRYKDIYPFAEIVPLSALTGENTGELLRVIKEYLPEGPRYFPDDCLTDRTERFMAAEIIREKALLFMQDEIPHGIAVELTEYKQKKELVEIAATIFCEKDSHKGMIIGKQGAALKKIGQSARAEIERLLGVKINLQTWVKVKKNWRDDEYTLRTLGYGRR